MQTLEFLRRVLPADGYYCGSLINKDGEFKNKFFDTIEGLEEFLTAVSNYGLDGYYAVSSFKTRSRRKQDNVLHTKIFAYDVDVGKADNSYTTRNEAMQAFQKFIAETKLPKPTIVSSGAGFHIYWTLTAPLGPEEWKPVADALKLLAQKHGLIVDPTVTGDNARILRAAGTLHAKSGKKVTVLMEGEDVPLSRLTSMLQVGTSPRRSNLINNLKVEQDFPPAVAGIVATKCQQINWAINHQDEVGEPLWYALAGLAAYTEDPKTTVMAWSEKHPQYSKIAAIQKMEQWKAQVDGPPTCARFENLRPGGCKGCIFKDRVNSPVRLGAQFAEAAPAADITDRVAHQVAVPKPFKRTAAGMVMTIEDTDIEICPFEIYPVSYGKDEVLGYEVVRFSWNRPHVGWVPLVLRQALLTEGHRDFPTAVADQGIVLLSRRQTELFQLMLRAYMDSLRKVRSLSNLYSSMGWKEDFTQFVIGDSVIHRDEDGQVIEERSTLAASTSKASPDMYPVKGTLAAWKSGTSVLERAGMPWHMFALNVGLSAPLYAFTGLKGLTVSLYGPTGGGKTLAQYWVQSIYGDPDRLHFSAKFTQNSLFSRLGMYNNLPMTIDEATMLKDTEIGDFLYWVSQGRDKARLNRAAEERDQKTWAAPVLVSTNKSLATKLHSSGLDSDAQMARLLEINIPAHKLFGKDSTAGAAIYSHLMNNYGHAGRALITKLVELGEVGVRKLIEDGRKRFYATYDVKFAGEERYWEQAVVLADTAGHLAHSLGLIAYDYSVATKWALSELGAIRTVAAEVRLDWTDLLGEYLNEHADATVTVMQTSVGKPIADTTRLPRGDVRARIHLWRKDAQSEFTRGTLLVDRSHFRRWLSSKGADYKSFTEEARAADATPKSKKGYLAKDTTIRLPQTYVIGFDLANKKLEGLLNEADKAFDASAFSKLAVMTT